MSEIDPEEVVRMYESELLSIREIVKRVGGSYGVVHHIISTRSTPRSTGYRARNGGETPPCGTKRAYQRHLDRGEEPDETCKQANRDYTNEINRRTGASRARNRAYRRLAKCFPDVFDALLLDERAKAQEKNEGVSRRTWRTRVRERAHRRLARLYPDTFQLMFAEEKRIVQNELKNVESNDYPPLP
ncbi:MAG TPA: hypothetical protein VFU43_27395 [Streptosporangiaceae bacterium]|nr:hypothetical protein [Streptosporangiaceae bacterium]